MNFLIICLVKNPSLVVLALHQFCSSAYGFDIGSKPIDSQAGSRGKARWKVQGPHGTTNSLHDKI